MSTKKARHAAADAEPLAYSINTLSGVLEMSKSAIYKMISAGKFPKPRMLSARAARWDAGEVRAWLDARPHRDSP